VQLHSAPASEDQSELEALIKYASCFAGKEAVTKALGTGFAGDITWRGIEILRQDSGAPYIRLSDEVLELAVRMGITDWFISISYLDEIAMASVLAVGR
jgi:holo-[acyl-carrier protein] synthase